MQDEEKQELSRVVADHHNALRRRAMTIPVARQAQHNRRNRHRVYRGDIPNNQGFAGLSTQIRRMSEISAKEKAAAAIDIRPTGLHVSFSLD